MRRGPEDGLGEAWEKCEGVGGVFRIPIVKNEVRIVYEVF